MHEKGSDCCGSVFFQIDNDECVKNVLIVVGLVLFRLTMTSA